MREPAVMFRLPAHVLSNVELLAGRLDISVNLVAKLIVTREIMHIPAILEEHERQILRTDNAFVQKHGCHDDGERDDPWADLHGKRAEVE